MQDRFHRGLPRAADGSPTFVQEMQDEIRYLLALPAEHLGVFGACLHRALRDLARPLARVLFALLPALLLSLTLPAGTGLPVCLVAVAVAALVLAACLSVRLSRHLRYRDGYSYRRLQDG